MVATMCFSLRLLVLKLLPGALNVPQKIVCGGKYPRERERERKEGEGGERERKERKRERGERKRREREERERERFLKCERVMRLSICPRAPPTL